jgi:hypothetical protein
MSVGKLKWRAWVAIATCAAVLAAHSPPALSAPPSTPNQILAEGNAAPGSEDRDSGQTPPPEPAPQPATAKECIRDSADFKDVAGQALFIVELKNACDKKIRCVVDAYVTTAKGPTSGHATLTIDGKAGAVKTYSMKIKQASGMANMSRDCRFL